VKDGQLDGGANGADVSLAQGEPRKRRALAGRGSSRRDLGKEAGPGHAHPRTGRRHFGAGAATARRLSGRRFKRSLERPTGTTGGVAGKGLASVSSADNVPGSSAGNTDSRSRPATRTADECKLVFALPLSLPRNSARAAIVAAAIVTDL